MRIRRIVTTAAFLLSTSPTFAGTVAPQERQIFYRAISRTTSEIRVAAKDGSNDTILAKFNGSISFDVGARGSGLIAVSSDAGLQLLRYAESGGQLIQTSLQTVVTGLPRAAALDLSPDGSRIAYRGGNGTKLMVYTIADGSNVEWNSGTFVWDLAWARNGASVVYMDHAPSGSLTHIYEAAAPQQFTQVFEKLHMDRVEASRTQDNLLLISYTSDDGLQNFIGTWRLPSSTSLGGWENPSLASRSIANRGVLSCDDTYLIYGSSSKSGAQVWYTRDLPLGTDQIINRVTANTEPQSWSRCPPASLTNSAFQFREMPR